MNSVTQNAYLSSNFVCFVLERSIEDDGAQHMQKPVTSNREMQATPKFASMENKGNLRDPDKLNASVAENFGDMGKEKSHNEGIADNDGIVYWPQIAILQVATKLLLPQLHCFMALIY